MALTTPPATLDVDGAPAASHPVPAECQPVVIDGEPGVSSPNRESEVQTGDELTPGYDGWVELTNGSKQRPRHRELTPLEPLPVLGQALVWLGGLLVAFALFQLWGTGLLEWRAQQALHAEFDAAIAEALPVRATAPSGPGEPLAGFGPGTSDAATRTPSGPTPSPSPTGDDPTGERATADGPDGAGSPPGEGAAIGRITIPAIGVSKTIVQGVERPTLRTGPGHYPTTPLPGQPGNAAIAGHRTTHGAPFLELDRLEPGDLIEVETLDGTYRYEVMGHAGPDGSERGHVIVDPSDVGVIGDHGDNRLTLTACHPRYTARERIIVSALLIGEPSGTPIVAPDSLEPVGSIASEPVVQLFDTPVTALVTGDAVEPASIEAGQTIGVDAELLDDSLGWRTEAAEPTVLWATVTAIVLHVGWIVSRLWRRRPAYALTAPVAVVPLFVCFIHLDRLLPAF